MIIAGNKVTKNEVITRELSFLKDSTFTKKQLQEDADKLINLGIFDKVKIDAVPADQTGENFSVIIEINEGPNIIPIPQGGIYEGELKKIWLGMNLKLKNFQGKNEEIGSSFGIGYQPFIELSYRDNWIGNESHFFIFTNLGYHKFINREIPYESLNGSLKDSLREYSTNRFNGTIGIGKFLSRYSRMSLAYSYNYNDVPDYVPGRTINNNGVDNYSTVSLEFNYDKRNDIEYTLNGIYLDIFYLKYGIGNNLDFHRAGFDFRKFVPIKISNDYSVTFAFRFYNENTFGGSAPDYLKSTLGYDNYIRGYNDYLYKGDNIFLFQSEFRIPVIKPFLVEGKKHPIIKSLPVFKDFYYQYGLYGTLFYELGGITSNNEPKPYSNIPFKNGYGIGLNALLPFNFIARMDFVFRPGISEFIKRFVFELDASF